MYRFLLLSNHLKLDIRCDLLLRKLKLDQLSIFNRNISECMFFSYPSTQKQDTIPGTNMLRQNQSFDHVLKTINFANISDEEAEQFLTSCSNILKSTSINSKNELCQELCEDMMKNDKVNLSFLHAYINVCTANNVKVNTKTILANIKFKIPGETYKLLLKNCCENNDIEEALQILDIMKSESLPLDEFVFNNLVFAHSASGGLLAAESVLNTMRAAKIDISNDTKFSILKGLSRYSSHSDFQKALKVYGIQLTEDQLIQIITELGLNNMNWLSEIKDIYNESTLSKEFKFLLKQRCINFLYMNKPDAALHIFQHFLGLFQEESNGLFILEEMICSNYEIETIKTSLKVLQDIGCIDYLLKNLTLVALKNKKTNIAWALLEMFSSELRPHFFWPFLILAFKNEGEVGIFEIVKKMKKMNVQFDFETWSFYIFPNCNLDDCKLLIKRYQDLGFTVKELLSPLLSVLIKNERVTVALDLCNHYNVNIFGEQFLNLLSKAWYSSRDSPRVVSILQKYCESNNNVKDFVGEFLTYTFKQCKSSEDFQIFLKLMKVIDEKSLKILSMSAENLKTMFQMQSNLPTELFKKLEDQLNKIFDFGIKSDIPYIPHPKDMSVEELENHLLELEEKNMNTRGILRKLILLHSSLGNVERMQELRKQFLDREYEESIGMKSSVFYSFIKAENIGAALEMYKDIKQTNPNFNLDDFKVIDLCTLLVKNDYLTDAWAIIKEEAKKRKKFSTKGIRRNCLELLHAFRDDDQQSEMFCFLVNNGYCTAENVLLGPLVKTHLRNGNLEKACDTYINITKKYKCTPLQLELLKEILKSQNEELLGKFLECTAQIHGNHSTKATLIAAAAECGKTSAVAKILSQNATSINNYLQQRCDRWVLEKKSDALMTLLAACFRTNKNFGNADYIIQSLIKTYRFNNDMEALIQLSNYLTDNEIETPAVQTIQEAIKEFRHKHQNG